MMYFLIEIDNYNYVIVMNIMLILFSILWLFMYLSREMIRRLCDMGNKRKINEMNFYRYIYIFLNILVI